MPSQGQKQLLLEGWHHRISITPCNKNGYRYMLNEENVTDFIQNIACFIRLIEFERVACTTAAF